ncbi:DUF4174 domain-containing protein [Pseudomonas sp. E141]|jgi:hypothetical protein|uniref:DUF4174 domain-containing protein n=1 Tax=Pseudomonas rhizophila TaxID=2045200 RepID=A0ABM6UI50_9PSED|nr:MULTISPECIES: DUF4174 domain-containing protein [Pseudomonas]AVU77168.1 DUF4174 domain-containing protein [Pseudomonas rhizophila]QKJ35352.1 DUF4174 domain-containing protein [Pseudomonas sp. MPDS]WLG21464.1 DUF4174 domain-containing protein [Pseudomonas sp. FP1154]WNZ76643.1 DUF4174 domain-containing protein [Pseudomonas sp. P105]SIR87753.1 protein of unknown function [Pseudomonas sp. A214]
MLIRSLTFATLLAIAGPLFAADGDSPLAADKGKSRPLIVIAPSTVDPAWVSLKKALEEPAGKQGFSERNLVLYTVLNTMGQRDGKDLDPQSTMALIRSLRLGAGAQTKIILVGKDGEKKLEHSGAIELKDIFDTVDKLPPAEKEAAAPAPTPAPEAAPAQEGKGAKAGKTGKPVTAPKPLED